MYTSPATWLALSVALLPTATAFYPYHYGDDSPTAHSRRTLSQLSSLGTESKIAGSITLPIRRRPISPTIQTRQNAYNIVNSGKPRQANSVAIDQDGEDLSYMVAVRFGGSKEEYHLLLDSAAGNTWVMGQDCATDACKLHNTFGKGDSSSLKTQDTPFSVTYGTGSVSGTLASDTLHIGSLSPTLTFGLATKVSQEFASYPMDGILGIGRGVKVDGSIDAPQLMDVLSSNKLISAKLYGIHFSRSKDGLNDGELNLGEVNKNRFSGDINYLNTMDNENGFWEIPMDDAGVDGKQLGITGRSAIMDTGTSFILMPQPDAVKIHSQIQDYREDGEAFSVPCETAATIHFSFNKQVYNISTADWIGGKLDNGLCRSNIVGRKTFQDTQWLVGDVFLKNVYSVYDFDQKRVGLGVKRAEEVPSHSSTGSSWSPLDTSRPVVQSAPTPARTGGAFQTTAAMSPGVAANPTAVVGSNQGQGSSSSQKGEASVQAIGSLLVTLVAFAASSLFIVG